MKKLIIIGGGFAGAYIAQKLQSTLRVTLFDTKDYFEFTPSVLRTLVEPNHIRKIEVRHRVYLPSTTVVREPVTTVEKTFVIAGGKKYPFDYLVIASGSQYSSPIKEENIVIASRGKELRASAQQLEKAGKVLIVGGGVVGTELAAEIAEHYPQKEITLVHARAALIERNPPKARHYAQQFLQQKGVTILFQERIVLSQDEKQPQKIYLTSKNKSISADLVFLCTGITPNSDFLLPQWKNVLDAKGFVRVNEYLQVHQHPQIFSAGDITTIPEEKTAQSAEEQAKIVVRNLLALEKGQELQKFVPRQRPMVISLGKWKGILVYKRWAWCGLVPGLLKQLIEWKTMRRLK
ncbi:FAD-dependent oxidoreductase [Candidatus Woesearchaeota archaeon]|nr:FAD-dependent oxidoreductase [Candidatus Woesearchaeota archaeon]